MQCVLLLLLWLQAGAATDAISMLHEVDSDSLHVRAILKETVQNISSCAATPHTFQMGILYCLLPQHTEPIDPPLLVLQDTFYTDTS